MIILPLPKLLGQKIDLGNIFSYDEIKVDDDYLYQLNMDKINSLKEKIEKEVLDHGYQNVSIYINCNIFENSLTFKSITVELENLVISENAEHKNITKIKKDITSIIKSYIEIDEEAILYDG